MRFEIAFFSVSSCRATWVTEPLPTWGTWLADCQPSPTSLAWLASWDLWSRCWWTWSTHPNVQVWKGRWQGPRRVRWVKANVAKQVKKAKILQYSCINQWSLQKVSELQDVMEEYLKRFRINLSDKNKLIQDTTRLEAQFSLILTQLKTRLMAGDCDSRWDEKTSDKNVTKQTLHQTRINNVSYYMHTTEYWSDM